MHDTVIYYLGTESAVLIEPMSTYYKDKAIRFETWKSSMDWKQVKYFLLLEPITTSNGQYAVSTVWKNWLVTHEPHVHLLVGAFHHSAHSNVLNLFKLPKALGPKLQQSRPVNTFGYTYTHTTEEGGIKKEQYVDEWEVMLPHSGERSLAVMKRFLKGHDRANSFFEQLTRLRTGMLNLEQALKEELQDRSTYYQQIDKEFKVLLNRWYHYQPLRTYLPFRDDFQQIEKHIGRIKDTLSSKTWQQYCAPAKLSDIEAIREILTEQVVPIVHAADYW